MPRRDLLFRQDNYGWMRRRAEYLRRKGGTETLLSEVRASLIHPSVLTALEMRSLKEDATERLKLAARMRLHGHPEKVIASALSR